MLYKKNIFIGLCLFIVSLCPTYTPSDAPGTFSVDLSALHKALVSAAPKNIPVRIELTLQRESAIRFTAIPLTLVSLGSVIYSVRNEETNWKQFGTGALGFVLGCATLYYTGDAGNH